MANIMILHKEKEAFKNAIQATAQYLKIREVYIEKDYWVTLALKRLSESEFKDIAIFKGGTSLSKALKCIERFSEDIDLAVITDELSNNQIKNLISNISKKITVDISEVEMEGITSKGSKFRKTVHEYDKIIDDANFGQAMDKLLVEINSFTTPNPHSPQQIESYIATFLRKTDKAELIEQYSLEPFHVNVLNVERTLVEKIMGLVRSSYHENPIDQLERKIRHIYDIERILKINGTMEFLFSSNFFSMIINVRNDDASNHEFKGDWINKPLASSLLFSEVDNVWDKIDETYNEEFKPFVYGDFPKQDYIKRALKIVTMRLKEFDKKENSV